MGQGQLIETEGVLTGLTMGVKGMARMVLSDKMGRVLHDTGWFPNIITDTGMYRIRDTTAFGFVYCQLGTSTGTPTVADTGCFSPIGTRDNYEESVAFAWSGTAYVYQRWRWRFIEGNGTGAIAEASLHSAASGGTCFSHFRIVDSNGNPTVINKGADQILDVFWEERNYIPQGDTTGTVDISGTTYNYTARAMNVGTTSGGVPINWSPPHQREVLNSSGVYHSAYTGELGPITGTPSGTSITLSGIGGVSMTVIGVGTFYNDVQLEMGPDGWILSGGIRSIRVTTGACQWQIRYGSTVGDLKIPKTNEQRLRMRFRLSWVQIL